MKPAEFSTLPLSAVDRATAWHRWFWPIFDVTPKAFPHGGFVGRNDVWNLGGLVVSHVTAPAAKVKRTRENLAKAPVDHWVLSCCRQGVTEIQTSRSLLKAPPMVPFLWSLGEASCTERTDTDRIQILLPRDMFPQLRTQLDMLRGSVLTTPSGAVLSEYMMALTRWLPHLPVEAQPRIASSLYNMISACLVPNADNLAEVEADMTGFLMDRIRRAIQAHLRSPSLGPEALCKMVGISRSGLYRLFVSSGGIMHYIRRQRLLQAHALLSDPLNRQTILAISEELCFSDASSFSRAFRHEFGSSPSDVRQAAMRGTPVPAFSGTARLARSTASSAYFTPDPPMM